MEPHRPLIHATETVWRWLARCWRLRKRVHDLARDFAASPTHVELNDLRLDNSNLTKQLAESQTANQELQVNLRAEEKARQTEYAKLKAKYDQRVHATGTEQVEALKTELRTERDAKHLLKLELDALKAQVKEHESTHQLARDGNRALLRFIHTRDRLNVKLEPETIRAMLQHKEKP
jgi:regulator of replication initiation timing